MKLVVWLADNNGRIECECDGDAVDLMTAIATQLKENGVVAIRDVDNDCFVIPRERVDHFSIISSEESDHE